jgi:cyclic pyranopterin phosphate synthase
MYDLYNREITYLRISVTDRCNLRCRYCMPAEGITLREHSEIISYEDIEKIAREAVALGITKIRLTGGEPLVRKGILVLVKKLKQIDGLSELTITTNGVLLKQYARGLKDAGMDRINVSLDTIDLVKYAEITRGGDLKAVLEGIDEVNSAGFLNTKLNMVLIPGFNEGEIKEMESFCRKKGLILQKINHYSLSDYKSISSKYEAERPLACTQCNRLRLMSNGRLRPCLFSDIEIPIDMNDIRGSIEKTVLGKPKNGSFNLSRGNWQIGG